MGEKKINVNAKMEEAVSYLYDIPRFTTKNSPEHTRDFLALLGNPQDAFHTIHVAGSNGKGSVCKFFHEMLLKTDKRIGLFTSPHLVDIRERFLIDGQMCTEEAFLEAYEIVKTAAEQQQANSGSYPTFFEFIFAVGMVLFERASVDYVVLETGLGGRLDATNSVTAPILTILTSISLEHTEYLGNTIALIAGEKAGIMKPHIPVVFDANEPEAAAVIEARAKQLQCPSYGISKNMCQILEIKRNLIDFSLSTQYDKKTNWQIPFAAEYQVMNASLAITGMRILLEQGAFALTQDVLFNAIAHTSWQGRMEEVLPDVFLDGAHNVAGITEFVKSVNGLLKADMTKTSLKPYDAESKKPILLFSMVKDKDYRHAISLLASQVEWDKVFVSTIPSQRGIPAEELQQIFNQEKELLVASIPDYTRAFDKVLELQQPGQMVFCTGSLYFIGALKEYISRCEKNSI
ncbi:MAG: bifunctional folylpolyglutamate synthase/dihydrofolate synthase [Eubacterium sp.]|nr:bifunctional folylpolyglutamate synthase/dihydrofolate synthase [Eubacterium sp.]